MASHTVVITGGGGFVGRYLVKELHENYHADRIVVWDKQIETLPDYVEGLEVDITQPATYLENLRSIQPEWLVHLAAVASVGRSVRDPQLTFLVNVEASRKLFEAIRQRSPHTKILAISSADIYGQGSDTPLSELSLAQAHPKNPYGTSKWQMEKIIEENFLDRVVRVRSFPHIGPGQPLGFVTADFASQIAAIEARKQALIIKVGNLSAKRDFTDVRDVVQAYRLLLEKDQMGEVYHVASGRAVSIKSILEQLLSQSTISIKVEQDPAKLRPSDIPVLVGDASKLRAATGWQPEISLENSLRDILAWWRRRYV